MLMVYFLLAGVDHGELVSLAEQYFGNVSLTHEFEIPEFKRCRFTGSEVMILFCAFSCVSFNQSVTVTFILVYLSHHWCEAAPVYATSLKSKPFVLVEQDSTGQALFLSPVKRFQTTEVNCHQSLCLNDDNWRLKSVAFCTISLILGWNHVR